MIVVKLENWQFEELLEIEQLEVGRYNISCGGHDLDIEVKEDDTVTILQVNSVGDDLSQIWDASLDAALTLDQVQVPMNLKHQGDGVIFLTLKARTLSIMSVESFQPNNRLKAYVKRGH